MGRSARFLRDGVGYYIQSHSYQNQNNFKAEADYEKYIQLVRKYKKRCCVSIYAYCITPTAVHLVVHPEDSGVLSSFMRGVNQSYALFFNRQYGCRGKVWGQRYKSDLICRDWDLFERIKAVEFIPAGIRLADFPLEYPWSSCACRVLGINGIVDAMPPAGPVLSPSYDGRP
jgi:REP element-mobilizing transposase RayT